MMSPEESEQEISDYAGEENDDDDLLPEEMEGLCQAFALLDTDGDGVIDMETLQQLLLSWGRVPMDAELDQIMSHARGTGSEGEPGMDFDGFRTYIKEQLENTRDECLLREAFEAFDSNPPTGKLNVLDLRHHLKRMGLRLTDAEIDFLYKAEYTWMLEEDNMFAYEHLINKILDKPICNPPFLNN